MNGVHVRDDQELPGAGDLRGVEHLHSALPRAQRDLCPLEHGRLLLRGRAVNNRDVDAETPLGFSGAGSHSVRGVVADKGDLSAFERADDAGRGPTTPVAPKMEIAVPSRSRSFFSRKT